MKANKITKIVCIVVIVVLTFGYFHFQKKQTSSDSIKRITELEFRNFKIYHHQALLQLLQDKWQIQPKSVKLYPPKLGTEDVAIHKVFINTKLPNALDSISIQETQKEFSKYCKEIQIKRMNNLLENIRTSEYFFVKNHHLLPEDNLKEYRSSFLVMDYDCNNPLLLKRSLDFNPNTLEIFNSFELILTAVGIVILAIII